MPLQNQPKTGGQDLQDIGQKACSGGPLHVYCPGRIRPSGRDRSGGRLLRQTLELEIRAPPEAATTWVRFTSKVKSSGEPALPLSGLWTMKLTKYLKADQKLILKPVADRVADATLEHLSTYLVDARNDWCDLRLPYGNAPGEQFPFEKDMPLELAGEALGLGIRIQGQFQCFLDPTTIRVRIEPDLEMFQRRLYPRQERMVGIRYTKGRNTLRSYREQWRKNVELLDKATDLRRLGSFPRCQVNLSPSGIRIPIKPPIAEADLCLLLIELEEHSLPICVLAEVVWTSPLPESSQLSAGMQFINIRKKDQQRIAALLNQRL